MEKAQFEQLTQVLKVTSTTFTTWLKQHNLSLDSPIDHIDALLIRSARGFQEVPTIQDYLSGTVTLLTSEEAFAMFTPRDLTKQQFSGLKPKFPVLVMGVLGSATYRYEASAVQSVLDYMLNFFTINIVKSLVDSPAAFQALRQNGLQPINPNNKVFSRPNVCRAIAQTKILPHWIAPDDWITARLKTICAPLLLLKEIATLCGVKPAVVEHWMETRQIWYMSHQGVTRFLSSSIPK